MSDAIKARYARALQQMNAGQSEAALATLAAIVMERPQTAEAHFQIGRIHAAAGRLGPARAALETALKHRPAERTVWNALMQVTPDEDHAKLATGVARSMAPEARIGFAAILKSDMRHGTAESVLRSAVEDGADAARLPLARLLNETCRPEAAEKVLLGAKQKTTDIWYQLAMIRARLRRPGPARDAMARAEKGGANPVAGAIELSSALRTENEISAAKTVMDESIRRQPKRGILYGQRGQLLQGLGELDAARDDLMRAITLNPKDGEAYRAYFAAAKVQAEDPLLAQCEAALEDPELPANARLRMHFAMAKALSDLGRHDEVFAHLHNGNGLQKKEFPFDFDAAVAAARANLHCVRDHLIGHAPAGAPGKVLFVAGLPRSGTTLVETVLAAHSQVTAGGEMPFLVEALRLLAERIQHGGPVSPDAFEAPGQRYLEAARRRLGGPEIFTDKSVATPYRIGLAAYALPEARFILPRRDPRDVGLSIYRNMFVGGKQRFSTDLYSIGRMIRLHDAMVEAWVRMFPGRVHIVDYEMLTGTPEPEIRAIVEAAGLPWEEACLSPHKADRRVDTLSFAQVRQPIYRSSVAGWKRYEGELGRLEEGLAEPVDLD